MYLVVYSVNSKFERHSFDHYDWSIKEEAKEVFKQLYTALHNDDDFHFFNISSTDRTTRHENLDDFTEMCNNEELSIDGSWTIWLNLTEADVLSVIDEYETDRLSTAGNGDEYYILSENFTLVDYPEEDFLLAYFDKVEAESELYDNENILLVKSDEKGVENGVKLTHHVYDSEGEHCFGSFERTYDDDFNESFRKFISENCEILKNWYGL